jgi:hypothetical protein
MNSDISQVDLEYFKSRAFTHYPDLSDLQPSVLENLTSRAEVLEPSARLKLYKGIIHRRYIIKQHQNAIDNLATLPNL